MKLSQIFERIEKLSKEKNGNKDNIRIANAIVDSVNDGRISLNDNVNDIIKYIQDVFYIDISPFFNKFNQKTIDTSNREDYLKAKDRLSHLDTTMLNKAKETTLNDEEFSTQEEIKNMALEMLSIFEDYGVKTSYNSLTNMNKHLLVKILNYNNLLKGLTKDLREELKKISLL